MANIRTTDEIVQQVQDRGGNFFDFETPDLIVYLPFEQAKPHLVGGATPDDYKQETADPINLARDYLPFAWEKANDNRGLSADRSVQHLRAWLWLAGYDLNADFDERYQYYGKPCLVVASEILGFDWRSADDGRWTNDESSDGISASERDAEIASAVAHAASFTPVAA